MSLLTSNWNYLGDQFYKKFEICQMLWNGCIDLEDCLVVLAPFGGCIALISKDVLSSSKSSKTNVTIYTAMGDMLSNFIINESIIHVDWSTKEDLVCVQPNGFLSLYDSFGQHISTLTLDQELRDCKIIDAKLYRSVHGTGVVLLTKSLTFYVYDNIYERKLTRLAEVPEMVVQPLSWAVVVNGKHVCVIVAKENRDLVMLNSSDISCRSLDITNEGVTKMAVSFDSTRMALFTETGKLILTRTSSNSLQVYSVFDTESKTKPRQLAWCGNSAVASHWANLIFFVDLNKNWLKYPTYSSVYMVQEIDCIRIVDNQCQELIKKVEEATQSIFKIGSCSSAAYLLEAARLYELQNHAVDDYLRLIQDKGEMEMAVRMCLDAACYEFNIATQKMLLRAASFGKVFVPDMDANRFVQTCQRLRILNDIRRPTVGIPLTCSQFETLTIDSLIDRLIERRLFLLALRISNCLKLAPELGELKILTRWAFFKVKQQDIDEEKIALDIAEKLQMYNGVSYAEIANKAIESGRKNLAIKLLDYELRAVDQVPLLLKLKQYRQALQKAIESGETDLIYFVIQKFDEIQTVAEFLMTIRDFPVAYALFQKYCKQEDPDKLLNIYFQEDNYKSQGLCYLEQSAALARDQDNWKKNKISLISSALDSFKKAKIDFVCVHSDEYLRLLKYQLELEKKFTANKYFNLSLQATMKLLLENEEYKLADELRKEFKVSEKRFYHVKLITLAQHDRWLEVEKLAKAKKSPIGYEPFVETCLKHRNRYEAQKYLPRVREENKIKYNVKTGNFEDAAKIAFEKKDVEALNYILSKTGTANLAFSDRLRNMIRQLK